MTEILLIRHGETEWNAAGLFRGRADIALNENGIRQAELLAEYLSEKKIDVIYASPLERARKTAEIIRDPGNSIAIENYIFRLLFKMNQNFIVKAVHHNIGLDFTIFFTPFYQPSLFYIPQRT